MTPPALALDDFLGAWSLDRRIDDKLTESTGHLAGKAEFTWDGDALVYREEGALRFDGQPPFTASRTYVWSARPEGGVEIAFEDGRPFHHFTFDRGRPEATHMCDPDMYHVTYDFLHWPKWSGTWRVQGPRKNYCMRSRYQRL